MGGLCLTLVLGTGGLFRCAGEEAAAFGEGPAECIIGAGPLFGAAVPTKGEGSTYPGGHLSEPGQVVLAKALLEQEGASAYVAGAAEPAWPSPGVTVIGGIAFAVSI